MKLTIDRAVSTLAAGAVLSVALLLGARPAAGQDLPLVSGNMEIAHKFLHGDAHVLLLGDSIQNGMIGAYPKFWKVDKWSGQVVGPNLGTSFAGNTGAFTIELNNPSPAFVGANFTYTPDGAPPGLAGFAPGAVQYVTFYPAQAPASGNLLGNRFYEAGLSAGQEDIYAPGKWADVSGGTMHVDVLLYANPQGLASGAVLDVRSNSDTTPDVSIPLSAQSATPGIVKFSGSFQRHTWDAPRSTAGAFRILPGVTPPQGSNLPILGVRYSTGEPGFQFANIAWGGKGIDYYLDPANTTDKNLKDYLDGTDSNMALIWLGQNDSGKYTPAQWKQKVQQLIGRYKTARPDMDFVLVSTYDTHADPTMPNDLAGYAQALYEIAQSDPDVLFLNLFKAAGDFSFLNANYLEDHVHPSLAGIDYFAGKTQELLALADTQVPEPGALAGSAGAALLLCRRRRRCRA
jgi:hypothetical protein